MALRLRAEGASLNQIVSVTGMAKSTVSLLVREVPLTDEARARLEAADPVKAKSRLGQLTWSRQCRGRRRNAQLAGRCLAGSGDARYHAGVMLYWAEGGKARNSANLSNADPELLRMWLNWVREWHDIPEERIKLVVNCFLNNGLSLDEIEGWWLERLEMKHSQLQKAIVNRPSRASNAVRSPLLYGTAQVRINSTFLVQSIYGAIQEIGGFERPEWLDLGGAMPEDPLRAD